MPKPFFISTFKNVVGRVMDDVNKKKEEKNYVVRGRHILVVDDIEVNRIILVKLFSTLGAICGTAGNGQEAIESGMDAHMEYNTCLQRVPGGRQNAFISSRRASGASR